MKKLDIWCEGVADQKFLADVIQSWFGLKCTLPKKSKTYECRNDAEELVLHIRATGSINPFISAQAWLDARKDFVENVALEIKNVTIVDADLDFQKRLDTILATTEGMIGTDNLFLWPNNQPKQSDNHENHDLELLLEQIMKKDSKDLFIDCWKGYESCLIKKSNPKSTDGAFFVPDRKAMVYAFVEAFTGEPNQSKEQNRDYLDSDLWELDGEKEPLKHLKAFLEKHIQNAA